MELTGDVLEKIEDKLWKNLEELNKDEKKWIEHGNSSHYSMCHFSDSYRYISCINLLHGLREVVNDDKHYIQYYGLEELETEEDERESVRKEYTGLTEAPKNEVLIELTDMSIQLSYLDCVRLIVDLKTNNIVCLYDIFDELLKRHEEMIQ